MANRIRKVKLEKVAKGRLAKQIIKDTDSLDLEIWENVEPGLSLAVSKKTIWLRLNYMVSTKRFLAWSGGIVATTGGVITVLRWFIPILQGYFANRVP